MKPSLVDVLFGETGDDGDITMDGDAVLDKSLDWPVTFGETIKSEDAKGLELDFLTETVTMEDTTPALEEAVIAEVCSVLIDWVASLWDFSKLGVAVNGLEVLVAMDAMLEGTLLDEWLVAFSDTSELGKAASDFDNEIDLSLVTFAMEDPTPMLIELDVAVKGEACMVALLDNNTGDDVAARMDWL